MRESLGECRQWLPFEFWFRIEEGCVVMENAVILLFCVEIGAGRVSQRFSWECGEFCCCSPSLSQSLCDESLSSQF